MNANYIILQSNCGPKLSMVLSLIAKYFLRAELNGCQKKRSYSGQLLTAPDRSKNSFKTCC